MPERPDKAQVIEALCRSIAAELAGVEAIAATTRDEVGSDETRQEGKYDTRSTEASYLARGQGWRIDELRRLASWFAVCRPEPMAVVRLGALVELEGPRLDLLFVAPVGGSKTTVSGRMVRVISPASPLFRAMEDLQEGDAFEVNTPKGRVAWEITQLS